MQDVRGTPRVRLVPLTEEHLDDLYAIYSNVDVMRFYDSFPHGEPAVTRRLIELFRSREEKGTGFRRGIMLAGSTRVVGTIGFNAWLAERTADLGYDLNRDFWGQGIMGEALSAVVRHGFEELEVHRIQAEVMPGNSASERLLLRSGFVREGLLRDKYFFKNSYQSLQMFSRLRSDA